MNSVYDGTEENYRVLAMGYNDTCSVGHNKALPGSDLDGAYIIIKGSNKYYDDKEVVDRFKKELWEKTDTRILSYNHQAAFPQVYTLHQFDLLLTRMEEYARMVQYKEAVDYTFGIIPLKRGKYYMSLKDEYTKDYVHANQFYIDLCSRIEKSYSEEQDCNNPTKEMAKNFGFLIETIVNGSVIEDPDNKYRIDKELKEKVSNTLIGKYTNLSQLQALKKNPPPKPKLVLRDELIELYKNSPPDKKYEIIEEIIRASCGSNCDKKYEKYFAPGEDRFAPLLRALGRREY